MPQITLEHSTHFDATDWRALALEIHRLCVEMIGAGLPACKTRIVRCDRLIIAEDRIIAVDFKTNATVPDRPETCPEGLLRQMGAYALALAQVFPDRRIDTAILWTRPAQIMMLPHDLVTVAAMRSPHLDVQQARS